jgi:hypothetical protein
MADTDVEIQFGAKIDDVIKGLDEVKGHLESLTKETEKQTEAISEGFKKAGESVKRFAEILGISLTLEGLKSFVEHMAELGLQTERTMATLGVSAEGAGELAGVAKLTGTSFEGLSLSLERMSLNIQRSTRDSFNPAAQALHALGLSAKDFIGLKGDEYFEKLAGAVGQFAPSMQLSAALMAIGGRGVQQLIPALIKGKEGYDELKKAVDETGAKLTSAQASAFAQTHEKLTLMGMAAEGLGIKIFQFLAPAIDKVADSLRHWLEGIDSGTIKSAIGAIADFTLDVLSFVGKMVLQIKQWIDSLGSSLDSLKTKMGGAAAGAIGGGVVGSIIPGVGTLGGAVVGGIGGFLATPGTPGSPASNAKAQLDDFEKTVEGWRGAFHTLLDLQGETGAGGGKKGFPTLDFGAKQALAGQAEAMKASITAWDDWYKQASDRLQFLEKTGAITHSEMTREELRNLDMRQAAETNAAYAIVKLYAAGTPEYAKAQAELTKITEAAALERQKIIEKEAEANQKAWDSAINDIVGAWNSQLKGLLAGTTSWAEAMRAIVADLVIEIIKEFEKAAAAKVALGLGGVALGGGGIGGALFAGLSGILGFEVGTPYVPQTGLALVHQGEAIIPASQNPAAGGAGGGTPVTMNINISALDGASVQRIIPMLTRQIASMMTNNPTMRPGY